jgi:benzoyl-CoA reductase/2-hydroxyglutaryl-CoA dehydratase subunit BcrC/BadD/HgdB
MASLTRQIELEFRELYKEEFGTVVIDDNKLLSTRGRVDHLAKKYWIWIKMRQNKPTSLRDSSYHDLEKIVMIDQNIKKVMDKIINYNILDQVVERVDQLKDKDF